MSNLLFLTGLKYMAGIQFAFQGRFFVLQAESFPCLSDAVKIQAVDMQAQRHGGCSGNRHNKNILCRQKKDVNPVFCLIAFP